jgi:hypothetical protein
MKLIAMADRAFGGRQREPRARFLLRANWPATTAAPIC